MVQWFVLLAFKQILGSDLCPMVICSRQVTLFPVLSQPRKREFLGCSLHGTSAKAKKIFSHVLAFPEKLVLCECYIHDIEFKHQDMILEFCAYSKMHIHIYKFTLVISLTHFGICALITLQIAECGRHYIT